MHYIYYIAPPCTHIGCLPVSSTHSKALSPTHYYVWQQINDVIYNISPVPVSMGRDLKVGNWNILEYTVQGFIINVEYHSEVLKNITSGTSKQNLDQILEYYKKDVITWANDLHKLHYRCH